MGQVCSAPGSRSRSMSEPLNQLSRAYSVHNHAHHSAPGHALNQSANALKHTNSAPTSPSAAALQRLQSTFKNLTPDERDQLLRDDLLLLAPVIQEAFHTLPVTTCTFIVKYDEHIDPGTTQYLWTTLDAWRTTRGAVILPLQTTGDGSCLLHAVSRGVWGVEVFSDILRHFVWEELNQNRAWYTERVGEADLAEALVQAASPHEYLSNLHIVALAHVLGRPIILYDSQEAMAQYGTGYYGVAGLFVPSRIAKARWYAWPVVISWASQHHNHYVPLAWTQGKQILWPWPEELLNANATKQLRPSDSFAGSVGAGPFAVSPETRMWLRKSMRRSRLEEPTFVLDLVAKLRNEVITTEGHLLARALAAATEGATTVQPPDLHGSTAATPGLDVEKSVLTSVPLALNAAHKWRKTVAVNKVRARPMKRRPPAPFEMDWPAASAPEAPLHTRQKSFRVSARDIAHSKAAEVLQHSNGSSRQERYAHASPAGVAHDAGHAWAELARDISERRRGLAVADVALEALQQPLPSSYHQVTSESRTRLMAAATAMVRISQELRLLMRTPLYGINAAPAHEDNLFMWRAVFAGPPGTAWEGGRYELQVQLPESYPRQPPTSVRFVTRMFHPNIDTAGIPCIDVLSDTDRVANVTSSSIPPNGSRLPASVRKLRPWQSNVVNNADSSRWSPYYSLSSILLATQLLLTEVFPEKVVNPSAGALYMSDRHAWAQQARECAITSRNQSPLIDI
eukprot:jgi/Chlat1/6410/Chrsp45S05919